jgi:hypothetical protein
VTKFILETKDITDSFFDGTRLLGIMAPVKDYQFCWNLNNMLGVDFRLNNELEIQLKRKNRDYFFGIYEYYEPAGSLEHFIYNNQFDGEYLLPEFKHLDFLWLMKGDIVSDEMLQEKTNNLRSINEVQLVVELSNEKIKNKEHLVF